MTKPHLILFDLDGTLIDSSKDLANSLNHVLSKMGYAELAHDHIMTMIGKGAKHLVATGLKAAGNDGKEETITHALVQFLAFYQQHLTDHTRCYKDVIEGLGTLKDQGHDLHICTNKPLAPTLKICETLGLTNYFSWISGGDSFDIRKPDPRHLLAHLDHSDLPRDRMIMVGDSDNDIIPAKTASIQNIGVTYGLNPSSLGKMAPDFLVDDFETVVRTINKITQ